MSEKRVCQCGRALFLRVCGVSAVGEEVELVQQREGEEAPDDQAHHREQRVEHPRRGFRGPPGVVADVFAEEEVQRRDDAACQQVILRNAEEVDLRKSDQRPVAEEHRQHDVDSLRKGQHQPDREDRHRAGHHRRGDHREGAAQQEREQRVDERHGEQQQREACMVVRALERSVFHNQVVYPDAPHDRPEERQHVVVLALFAV